MSQIKQQVRELLDRLPDDCTFEDVQHHLYIIQVIQRRIEACDRGEVIPHSDVQK